MIKKLLDATLSVDDFAAKTHQSNKNRKRQLQRGKGGSLDNADKNQSLRKRKVSTSIHVPHQIICEHISKFLFPEEALRVSITCKEAQEIAKIYDRNYVGKKNLHGFAVRSFNPSMVGLISLDCALRKTCGVCGGKFMGRFCTKYLNGRLYAHEKCVMRSFINLENVGALYGLRREDLPPSLKIWDLRLPRKRYVLDQVRIFSNFWIWNEWCDMIPVKWTFQWILYHDPNVRKKVLKYFTQSSDAMQTSRNHAPFQREFLLAQYEELRHPLFFEGVMYPTRVHFAKKLGENIDLFRDFFKVTKSGTSSLSLADACVRTLAITVRAFDIVEKLKTMQVAYDHIVTKEGIECGKLTLDCLLRSLHTKRITKDCLGSCLNIDGEKSVSPQQVVDVWKKWVWNKVRIARVEKLLQNPKLNWIVKLQFEDAVGDYLTAWIPETTYGYIENYVSSLFLSRDFQNADVSRPSESDIIAFNTYLSYQRLTKNVSVAEALDLGACGSVTEKVIKLCKRLSNIRKEINEHGDKYRHPYRCSNPQINYVPYDAFERFFN